MPPGAGSARLYAAEDEWTGSLTINSAELSRYQRGDVYRQRERGGGGCGNESRRCRLSAEALCLTAPAGAYRHSSCPAPGGVGKSRFNLGKATFTAGDRSLECRAGTAGKKQKHGIGGCASGDCSSGKTGHLGTCFCRDGA